MYETKEIGCFNVTIDDGNLNHEDNHWYYGLQIDRFEKGTDKPLDHKRFYIRGHRNEDFAGKMFSQGAVSDWLDEVTEEKVEKLYQYKENHRFQIVEKATQLK